MIPEELHDEGGDAAVDPDEDVDAGEDHVGRAGDTEEERRRVHQRRDGPPAHMRTNAADGRARLALVPATAAWPLVRLLGI